MKFTKILLATAVALPLLATYPVQAKSVDQPKLSDFHTEQARHPCLPPAPLSEETLKMVRETFEQSFKDNKPTLEAITRTQNELRALAGAPGYTHQAYQEKGDQLANLKALIIKQKEETTASVLDKLTPDERRSFAAHHMHPTGLLGHKPPMMHPMMQPGNPPPPEAEGAKQDEPPVMEGPKGDQPPCPCPAQRMKHHRWHHPKDGMNPEAKAPVPEMAQSVDAPHPQGHDAPPPPQPDDED